MTVRRDDAQPRVIDIDKGDDQRSATGDQGQRASGRRFRKREWMCVAREEDGQLCGLGRRTYWKEEGKGVLDAVTAAPAGSDSGCGWGFEMVVKEGRGWVGGGFRLSEKVGGCVKFGAKAGDPSPGHGLSRDARGVRAWRGFSGLGSSSRRVPGHRGGVSTLSLN